MNDDKLKDLTTDDICNWIVANRKNREEMDTISNLIFPHTTKYQQYYNKSTGDDL